MKYSHHIGRKCCRIPLTWAVWSGKNQIGSKMLGVRVWEKEEWVVRFNGNRVSVWEDGKVLERGSGHGCTTTWRYLMLMNNTLKSSGMTGLKSINATTVKVFVIYWELQSHMPFSGTRWWNTSDQDHVTNEECISHLIAFKLRKAWSPIGN